VEKIEGILEKQKKEATKIKSAEKPQQQKETEETGIAKNASSETEQEQKVGEPIEGTVENFEDQEKTQKELEESQETSEENKNKQYQNEILDIF